MVVIAGMGIAWLSSHVGYPVHWMTWSVFVSIALWATFEVADS